jgi:hypothetical protein
MDSTFHVEAGEEPDWAEWRLDVPTLGECVPHDGRRYSVVSSVCWLAQAVRCFVAVRPLERVVG